MDSRIPLPTDNIYKFYALFGLLLIIFVMGSVIYVTNAQNSFVIQIAVEYEELKADHAKSIAEKTRFNILERQLEIKGSDKRFYLSALSAVGAIGFILMFFGFRKWHKEIQPMQDELLRLSIKKMKKELGENESS